MSGRMRKRQKGRTDPVAGNIGKGFHPPQKDNSVRSKKRAKLNNYNDQKKEKEDQ